jgi:hypothetical protein
MPDYGGMVRKAVEAVGKAVGGIRAYHGSPHDFERFDMSKIGTGEGAQAYGHGLYFAEKEATAQAYRDALSSGTFRPGGRMYEVNINADPKQFLDFDRPFSAQNDAVRSVFQKFGYVPKDAPPFMLNDAANQLAAKEGSWSTAAGGRNVSEKLREAGIPGIKYLDQGSRLNVGNDYALSLRQWQDEFKRNPTDNAAKQVEFFTNRLKETERPTSNYVLFRDDIIDILRKYGLAGAAPAGAAGYAEQLRPYE